MSDSTLIKEDKKASQGFVDIRKMSLQQLNELIRRQNKLLLNRLFLEKLPDKGNKILLFKATLETEYEKRQEEYETACQLLCNLSIKDKSAEELEWNQGENNIPKVQCYSNNKNCEDDIEGEEKNPLKLFATHSGTAKGKNCKIIHSFESIMTKKNTNEAENISYVHKFCEKYENLTKFQERFRPNQLKNNDKTLFLTSAEKVKKKLGNKWEITQATPPVPVFKNTVMISLPESLKLQKEQMEKLKETERKLATEKLLQNLHHKMGDNLAIRDINTYRNTQSIFDEIADDDEDSFTDLDIENK